MTNKKSSKRTLLLSVVSMLICVVMLVGATFAWFTDSVTSGKNRILAGNLDIELDYSKTMADGSWKTVEDATDLFSTNLWEPGYTEVVYLKITNLGTLALKYNLSMNYTDTVVGKSILGNDIILSEYLKYGIVDVTAKYADRNAAREAVEENAGALSAYSVDGTMLAGDPAKTVALVVYMPEEVGNEANYRGDAIPRIDIGLNLVATQKDHGSDSFGNDYDKNAGEPETTEVIVTPENIGTMDFNQDNTKFLFKGSFTENATVTASNGLRQIYDGSAATFADGAAVTVNTPGVAHSYADLSAKRSGNVTVKGFNVDTLNILAYSNESVTISENNVGAMSVIGGNFDLTVDSNKIDGSFGVYKDGEDQTNDYGISLRITDYELSLTNNTITDTYSHAIGINGRQGETSSDWGSCGTNNKIEAFSGNNITVNTTYKSGRAALKIWCDQAYAPYATSGHQPNDNATALMADILADTTNVFTLGDGHTTFNIFDYKQ